MEIERWRKDTNPYFIFSCFNCKRWLYMKSTQKTKRCFQCGKIHNIKSVEKIGTIVNGLNNAIEHIKNNQHALSITELGNIPDLRIENDFVRAGKKKSRTSLKFSKPIDNDYSPNFQDLLTHLQQIHSQFPEYMISMLAEEYRIPESEIPLLIRKYRNLGILIVLERDYYTLKGSGGSFINNKKNTLT